MKTLFSIQNDDLNMKIITNTSIHSKQDWGKKKKLFKINGKGFLFNEFFGLKQVLSDISSMHY